MPFSAKHLSVSIERSPAEVYAYVSNPENLPAWAAGLSGSIRKQNGEWISDSPMGEVKVRFVENNKFGVLDHLVTLPGGVEVYIPMRVVANETGSEIIFTLFRLAGMSEETFSADAILVEKDLRKLKEILEK